MIDFKFNLKCIRDLLPFRDLFCSSDEYMQELSCLSKNELETEALYTLTSCKRILFTPKLRYYSRLLERKVNRHINKANCLMESENSEELSKYIIKQIREAAITLVQEINRELIISDTNGSIWKNISSDNPHFSDCWEPLNEKVVFYHNAIAELTRCWLEMQDRYAYLIGADGLYDVDLFYSSIIKRQPDMAFEIKCSEKYEAESKKFKKYRTDSSFCYDTGDNEYFNIAIQEFTNKLKKYKLIEQDVDFKQMESLFQGRSCRTTIKWLGDKHILTWIIKGLCSDATPVITTWPEGIGKWMVVEHRFIDKDGTPMTDIRTENERKSSKSMVGDIVRSLSAYKR